MVKLKDLQTGKRPSSRSSVAKNNGMPLKLRPTGLGSEIDKDRQDYTVYIGKWAVGRIYDLRWFWSFSQHGPMMRSGRVSTLEEAKAQFQRSWDP